MLWLNAALPVPACPLARRSQPRDGNFDLRYHFGQKGSWFNVGVPDRTNQGASKC